MAQPIPEYHRPRSGWRPGWKSAGSQFSDSSTNSNSAQHLERRLTTSAVPSFFSPKAEGAEQLKRVEGYLLFGESATSGQSGVFYMYIKNNIVGSKLKYLLILNMLFNIHVFNIFFILI